MRTEHSKFTSDYQACDKFTKCLSDTSKNKKITIYARFLDGH